VVAVSSVAVAAAVAAAARRRRRAMSPGNSSGSSFASAALRSTIIVVARVPDGGAAAKQLLLELLRVFGSSTTGSSRSGGGSGGSSGSFVGVLLADPAPLSRFGRPLDPADLVLLEKVVVVLVKTSRRAAALALFLLLALSAFVVVVREAAALVVVVVRGARDRARLAARVREVVVRGHELVVEVVVVLAVAAVALGPFAVGGVLREREKGTKGKEKRTRELTKEIASNFRFEKRNTSSTPSLSTHLIAALFSRVVDQRLVVVEVSGWGRRERRGSKAREVRSFFLSMDQSSSAAPPPSK